MQAEEIKPQAAPRFIDMTVLDITDRDVERFWGNVDKTGNGPRGECWHWVAARNEHGYGMMRIRKRSIRAHRISALLAGKLTDASLDVCHECDNPQCVNPSHLFVGTALDNMRDMVKKGRHASKRGTDHIQRGDAHWSRRCPELVKRDEDHPHRKNPTRVARGEKAGLAKLTDEIVLLCRRSYFNKDRTQRSLAKEYGVSSIAMFNAIHGKTWKHIQEKPISG